MARSWRATDVPYCRVYRHGDSVGKYHRAPRHSLLTQSLHAIEAKLSINGDGFGISWYSEGQAPGLYRDVLPAWADDNLTQLCRMVRSQLFDAHNCASTVGETSRANCHPFPMAAGRFAIMARSRISARSSGA